LCTVQETHKCEKNKIDDWATKHDYLVFLNHFTLNHAKSKILQGTAFIIRNKIKQIFDISPKIITENRVQVLELSSPQI